MIAKSVPENLGCGVMPKVMHMIVLKRLTTHYVSLLIDAVAKRGLVLARLRPSRSFAGASPGGALFMRTKQERGMLSMRLSR
jgi:hypothetical protein